MKERERTKQKKTEILYAGKEISFRSAKKKKKNVYTRSVAVNAAVADAKEE